MLVITRKPGERIRLGNDITVTVLDVAGSTVRLGIDAPAEIPVFRHEVWEAIEAENRAAADASVDQLLKPDDSAS
jgi:carbon storage regulator